MSGLVLRLSAGNIGLSDGDSISTWMDTSGQNNNATQGTIGNQPLFRINVQNGLPGVEFISTGKSLSTPSFLNSSFNTAFSYYAVVKHTASGLTYVSSNGGAQWFHGSNGTESINTNGLSVASKTLGENPAHLLSFRYDGSTEKISTNGPVQTNTFGFNGARTSGRSFSSTGNLGLAGALTIGQLSTGGSTWDGQILEMLIYQRALSDSEDTQVNTYLNNKYNFLSPFSKQVLFVGNSLTAGFNLSSPATQAYPAQTDVLLGQSQWGYTNLGVTGITTPQLINSAPGGVDAFFDYRCTKNIAALWEVTNDLSINQNESTAYSNYVTWCQGRQTAGFKVVSFTVLPRSVASSYSGFEADRQAINTSIRTNWATFSDVLCDVGADSNIGVPGSQTNTTYYQGDQIHLNPTGAGVVASYANTAIAGL